MGTIAIVASSDFNEAHFRALAARGAFSKVIAADGGYAHVKTAGYTPDLTVGDFDSLGFIPDDCEILRFPAEKDESDLALALDCAAQGEADTVVVYGALGGRLDHTMAAIAELASLSERGFRVFSIGTDAACSLLTGPDSLELPAADTGIVSVFSLNDFSLGVSESGLKYPLDDAVLSSRTSWGLSNEMTGVRASVSVDIGTLLVFFPLAVSEKLLDETAQDR